MRCGIQQGEAERVERTGVVCWSATDMICFHSSHARPTGDLNEQAPGLSCIPPLIDANQVKEYINGSQVNTQQAEPLPPSLPHACSETSTTSVAKYKSWSHLLSILRDLLPACLAASHALMPNRCVCVFQCLSRRLRQCMGVGQPERMINDFIYSHHGLAPLLPLHPLSPDLTSSRDLSLPLPLHDGRS